MQASHQRAEWAATGPPAYSAPETQSSAQTLRPNGPLPYPAQLVSGVTKQSSSSTCIRNHETTHQLFAPPTHPCASTARPPQPLLRLLQIDLSNRKYKIAHLGEGKTGVTFDSPLGEFEEVTPVNLQYDLTDANALKLKAPTPLEGAYFVWAHHQEGGRADCLACSAAVAA
eukprot:359965-Chlamydomonas_euryale.AAC.6